MPFKCKICSMQTANEGEMTRHVVVHWPKDLIKDKTCVVCNKPALGNHLDNHKIKNLYSKI